MDQNLKVFRWSVFGIVGAGIVTLIARGIFEGYSSSLVVGLALAAALALLVVALNRSVNAPVPPRYSDSELQGRVRDALKSNNVYVVQEVLRDVSDQWGDNKDYRKLTIKLFSLRGVRAAVPESDESWDYSTLQRLYPTVYGEVKDEEEEGGKHH